MKKFSIVVPIFNVKNFINQCIDSLIGQDYSHLEIILVDDGSTDGSSDVCDEYKKKYNNIVVVHKNNGGLTSARRSGVNAATGDYVGFVDGDDWVDHDFLSDLYKALKDVDADIITSRGIREYENVIDKPILKDGLETGVYDTNTPDLFVYRHMFSSCFDDKTCLNGAVWNKLFKREIISSVLNTMPDNVSGYMDDNVCLIGSLLKSAKLIVTDICKYHHREHSAAFTYRKNAHAFSQINNAYLCLKSILEKSSYYADLYPLLCEHTSKRLIDAYNNFFEDTRFNIPVYYFKGNAVPIGSKVIIYGNGDVGKSYCTQFACDNRYNVVGMVDKYDKSNGVYSICDINTLEFDYVIIAIKNESVVHDVIPELKKIGIQEDKIVWESPVSVFEFYTPKN